MSNKSKNKNDPTAAKCPFFEECPIMLHPLSAIDSPNMAAHLGFRMLYTLIAWLVLGYNVNEGFFLSMCFFALPVFMDCLKFTPLSYWRKIIRKIEIFISGLLFVVSLIGVIGIYKLKLVDGVWIIVANNFVGKLPTDVHIEWIWDLLGLIVIITVVDWLCNEPKIYEAMRKKGKEKE